MIFFPFCVIIRLVLHFLEPIYKSCLQIKSKCRFSLVHYFWSLASKIFLFLVMVNYMPFTVLQHLIEPFSNSNSGSGPFSSLLLSSHCPHSDSICSTLWISCSFLFGNLNNNSWQELDANSVYPTDLPLLFPSLNIFFGMLLIGYPCVKLVECHHLAFGLVWCSGQKDLLHLF